ncbi:MULTISPECIES: bacterioferritin [Methylomonas]|uniref:Bacterioferritin n=2 Tax=Methylomonas TaxID=416 RepID=A0A140E4G7_9GAMM|nr:MULTISPECIES: bacterioferritin [Methylomonas]AMK75291.1 bacterioferritin [Methylomonas denitrificans]OAH99317.1 bacterioferritin [Methylomonas methanica]TCV84962.1 bacterioferritin [Methylomonas methanica]
MQGDKQVIAHLNELLAGELTAIDQYFIHSRMYENWGFGKLYERINHEVQDETNHADALIKRILFLEGTPDLSKREPLAVGADVPEMLKNDLAVEYKVVADLRKVIAYCESVRDYQTREILEVMLDDTEEDHAHWLEQQLGLINIIGLQNYLQSQMS